MKRTPPAVDPDEMMGIGAAAQVLGCDRGTLAGYAKLPLEEGGIRFQTARSGRKVFCGYEISRFWYAYWGVPRMR